MREEPVSSQDLLLTRLGEQGRDISYSRKYDKPGPPDRQAGQTCIHLRPRQTPPGRGARRSPTALSWRLPPRRRRPPKPDLDETQDPPEPGRGGRVPHPAARF